jgi:2-deoxy-scyllo-inosamine dehydrogenase (SAM-dependent)
VGRSLGQSCDNPAGAVMIRDLKTPVTMWLMRASAYRRQGRACPISSIAIEISQHCNRRCTYCPVSTAPKPVERIDRALFQEIVEQLAAAGFDGKIKYHFFNEPLLNKDLEALVAFARARVPRARNVIYTNGDLLTERRARRLFAAGVDRFIVTDHGGRALTPFVVSAGSRWRWSRSGVTIRTIDRRTFLFNRGGLLDLARTRHFGFCAYPAYEAVINIDGNVLMCCNDYHGAHVFGNVQETPLIEIWESEPMRRVREELMRGVFRREMCQHCVAGTLADAAAPRSTTQPLPLLPPSRKPSIGSS